MWAIKNINVSVGVVSTLSYSPLLFDTREEAESYLQIYLKDDPNFSVLEPRKCTIVSMK